MKPTKAWISYCTDPANAWLQELWGPAVGDWVKNGGFTPKIVVKVDGDKLYFGETGLWQFSMVRFWLPTFSDLLGMIEEASVDRQFVLGYVPEYKEWYTSLEVAGEDTWPIVSNEDSKESAAAELLKRLQ